MSYNSRRSLDEALATGHFRNYRNEICTNVYQCSTDTNGEFLLMQRCQVLRLNSMEWHLHCLLSFFLWKLNSRNLFYKTQSNSLSLFVLWENFRSNLCRHLTSIMESTLACRNKCNFKHYLLGICIEKRAEILWVLWIYGRIGCLSFNTFHGKVSPCMYYLNIIVFFFINKFTV